MLYIGARLFKMQARNRLREADFLRYTNLTGTGVFSICQHGVTKNKLRKFSTSEIRLKNMRKFGKHPKAAEKC